MWAKALPRWRRKLEKINQMRFTTKIIEQIILDSELAFTAWRTTLGPRDAKLMIRPDVKRVSSISTLLERFVEPLNDGRAVEIGCGYGYLLFPLATLFQQISWCGVDDPAREYTSRLSYQNAFAAHKHNR